MSNVAYVVFVALIYLNFIRKDRERKKATPKKIKMQKIALMLGVT